jgi:hypothetical protein
MFYPNAAKSSRGNGQFNPDQKNKGVPSMTRKQLQTLISAGAFSAALLAGTAYADDASSSVATSTSTVKHHHHKNKKNMAQHACAGKNSCKGQGGCKTSDGGCSGKNSCSGKGGCATDGSKMPGQ